MGTRFPVCLRTAGSGIRAGHDPTVCVFWTLRRCTVKVVRFVCHDALVGGDLYVGEDPADAHCTDSTPLSPRDAGRGCWFGRMAGLATFPGRYGAERRAHRADDVGRTRGHCPDVV